METCNISLQGFSNIQYRKQRSGNAIVLLHGFPEDGTLWEQVVPVLAKGFSVIVPDIPGSGGSKLEEQEISIDALADSIAGILEHEKIEEAVIVGHSMGGYIALSFAEKYRKQVKGLSLVHSTATADTEEKKAARRKAIDLIKKGGKEPFVRGMIPNLFAADFKELHPEIIERQIERGMKLSDTSMIAFYNAMINRRDRTNILSSADFPVQWIIGSEDNIVPLSSSLQQSTLASVNYVSLYNCGHMSMIEAPERLANDLNTFGVYCYNR
ncbi:MAG TPA: alpha/beta hydrolase [Flavipsychrobacter sp.]|nr:alpha/beta hydrolase [Flavipsychrobacter sp.]